MELAAEWLMEMVSGGKVGTTTCHTCWVGGTRLLGQKGTISCQI